ncbi:uncharacterized protein LOC123483103 [Coregonus clupeaformis]|uniref:uncharacterized protein LOC123483103 n=1 Tax=Coregonus clupeaformis TaxID=59861 RepID=UPI001E1C9C76|nr:uncharacterized protein LOC123483103 [Coregonus clupeaformis]
MFVFFRYQAAQIRLVNGFGRCSGRVEIYYSGQWGTVCDDDWDMNDAAVVCGQLGCGSTVGAPLAAHFGQGSEPTWLDNVKCSGSESHLSECSHRRFGVEDCNHGEDAGVFCLSGLTLKRPTLSKTPSHSAFSPGETVQFICSVSQRIAITANFDLYRGGSPILTQAVESTQTSETFTLSSLQSSHQGRYSCLQQITKNGQKMISSSSSNSMDITIVTLPKPQIYLRSATEVAWGKGVDIICSITTQHLHGTFSLQKTSGSFRMDKTTSSNSVTFNIPKVDFSHEGSYRCQYQTRVSSRDFSSTQSYSVEFSVIVVLLQPNISLSAPNGWMVWGLQGPEVTRGHSFSITCSIQPQYPGGLFYLDFSGSNRTETTPAVNHSASFHFPVAEYKDQGNYSCVYEVNVSTLSFRSTKTELLTVSIRGKISFSFMFLKCITMKAIFKDCE